MPDLAFVHHNLSPYFQARVRAAAQMGDVLDLPLHRAGDSHSGPGECVPIFSRDEDLPISGQSVATRVRRILQARRPRTVVVQGWAHESDLAALAWCAGNPTPVVMLGEFQTVGRRPGLLRDLIKRRLFRYCGAFLVGGSAHADYVAGLGVPRERVAVGYDVVDNRHFADGARQARAAAVSERERLGLPERYFLAVSRLDPEKNLRFLLRAYAAYRLACGERSWPLVIVGAGSLLSPLRRQCQQLRIGDRVIMVGERIYADMPACYGLASALIHASTFEPWGLVVNEAMAAGLPVFVSRLVSSAVDLVADGKNGFTFDPYDPPSLTILLVRTTQGEYDLQAMGRESETRIASWTPQVFAARLWEAAERTRATPVPPLSAPDAALLSVLQLGRGPFRWA